MKRLKDYVSTIPDFPKKGIMFRDITSVLQDADGFALAIDEMIKLLDGVDFDVLVGAEARGFVLGAPIAYKLHKPFVLARKKGKLPRETITKEYALEYGTTAIEMHKDSIKKGQRVVLVDDLLATGGTIKAARELVEELGGEIAKIIFLIELVDLKGREKLKNCDVASVITYEGE
ncbi:MAG: adenine phosphoribosyltransferase [Lachnospiraceae bacterium]|nr:adenine phosphoribosyltransferase [Lachnospiraceae bacterium]